MGRAKKRYYKLHKELRAQHPAEDPLKLYSKAIDIDQRKQAALQAERWRKEQK
jgi:hypothetical protein